MSELVHMSFVQELSRNIHCPLLDASVGFAAGVTVSLGH